MKVLAKKRNLKEAGFTLIEILVVTVILGILVAVASTVLIDVLRNQNKTNLLIEIRQNAGLVLDTFERDVRASNDATVVSSTSLTLTKPDGSQIFWYCRAGYISRKLGASEVSLTDQDTLNGVNVNTCSFSGDKTGITLIFHVIQSGASPTGRVEFSTSDTTFSTTIGVRSGSQ